MDVTAYARILRQRWQLLLLPCLVAIAVAAITLPEEQKAGPVVTTYQATATLITTPSSSSDAAPLNLSTVALFATTGEIPERAAEMLNFPGEPQILATMVTVTPQSDTGTLTINTLDPDGRTAARRVNVFAEATIAHFEDEQEAQVREQRQEINRQLTRVSQQLADLRRQQGSSSDPVLDTRADALESQYGALFGQLSSLESAPDTGQLSVLQAGVPIPQTTQSFVAPTNPYLRIGIAAVLGLLLGGALALLVERLDSRMRTREQVEDATGLPVLAEVPLLPRGHRAGVVSASRPASSAAEAFRTLRSAVLLSPGVVGTPAKGGSGREAVVLLVTSALPGAGKTTTVANLAAVMAEAGRRVLVLSLDLRNPTLHQYFGQTNVTGISELLSADRGRHLEEVVHATDVPGVSIATSGRDTDHPGALLASVRPLMAAARGLADVVIIDAPPLLVVSDALDLARHADVTLLVSKLNKTTRTQAQECQRLFTRLGVSALGTVLVGSRPAGARYGYPTVRPAPNTDAGSVGDARVAGATLARDGD